MRYVSNRNSTVLLQQRSLIALCLGLLLGVFLNTDISPISNELIITVTSTIGSFFVRTLSILVLPIVVTHIVSNVAFSNKNNKLISGFSTVGNTTLCLYIIITFLAAVLGAIAVHILQPGFDISISNFMSLSRSNSLSFAATSTLIGSITAPEPTGILSAILQNKVVYVLILSVIVGIAISMSAGNHDPVWELMNSLVNIVDKLTQIIIAFVPIGVLFVTTAAFTKYGLSAALSLIKLILVLGIASILHMILVHSIIVYISSGESPVKFFVQIFPALAFAFSSHSSFSTMPITLYSVKNSLKISPRIANFTIPLGVVLNRDGTCLYVTIVTIFLAQISGIHFTFTEYILICLATSLISIGVGGIPGGSIILLPAIMASIGIPVDGIAIVATVDRILDSIRTCVNVCGNCVVAVAVSKISSEYN